MNDGTLSAPIKCFYGEGGTIIMGIHHTEKAVVIGGRDPDDSSILEVRSQEKGFLPPRMSTVKRLAIKNPAVGLVVFDIDQDCLYLHTAQGWTTLMIGNQRPFWSGYLNTPQQIEPNSWNTLSNYKGKRVIGKWNSIASANNWVVPMSGVYIISYDISRNTMSGYFESAIDIGDEAKYAHKTANGSDKLSGSCTEYLTKGQKIKIMIKHTSADETFVPADSTDESRSDITIALLHT